MDSEAVVSARQWPGSCVLPVNLLSNILTFSPAGRGTSWAHEEAIWAPPSGRQMPDHLTGPNTFGWPRITKADTKPEAKTQRLNTNNDQALDRCSATT